MIRIKAPEKLSRVFEGDAEIRGAYGGRGSGKTRNFAAHLAFFTYKLANAGVSGQILCARQFMNSLDESSFAEIKASILETHGMSDYFDLGEKYIRTKGLSGRIDFVFAGLSRNIDSLKSKARILICWVDEAEQVTESAWSKLLPTIREKQSELWLCWNPEKKGSPTDLRFRQNRPDNSKIIEMNWRDNPWFNQTRLASQRIQDKRDRPSTYDHIWEGGYALTNENSLIKRHWLKVVDDFPREGTDLVRYWDLAGTIATGKNDPDWTAGCFMKSLQGQYFIIGMDRFRDSPLGNRNRIKSVAEKDGRGVPIWIQRDVGQSAKDQIDAYSRDVLPGFAFRGHHKGKKSKIDMADPFAAACEAGNVFVVRKTQDGFGLLDQEIETLLSEIEFFPSGPHDDQVDAITGAFDRLVNQPLIKKRAPMRQLAY